MRLLLIRDSGVACVRVNLVVPAVLVILHGVLVVLGREVVHVGLSFAELHLIHAFASVPVKESLTLEHSTELIPDSLEHVLDRSVVTHKRRRKLEARRRDITYLRDIET